MLQALYDPTAAPGTFFADIRVDEHACADLLSPANSTATSLHFFNSTPILLPTLDLVGSSPQWASEMQVAVATVSLDADGKQLPDTFYPYYGSTTRKVVVPTAPNTFQSEFRPYAIVHLSQEAVSPARATTGGQAADDIGTQGSQSAVPGMHVTAEQVREGEFILRAALNSSTIAPFKFAIVEGNVATGVLSTASDPRRAILCALDLCIDGSDSTMWPEGSIVATGSLEQQSGVFQHISQSHSWPCGDSTRFLKQ